MAIKQEEGREEEVTRRATILFFIFCGLVLAAIVFAVLAFVISVLANPAGHPD